MALSDGWNLEISRLSLNKSSKVEEQEVRIEKSSGSIAWPEDWWWDRMLEKEGFERGLPVQAEIPICSEMRVYDT